MNLKGILPLCINNVQSLAGQGCQSGRLTCPRIRSGSILWEKGRAEAAMIFADKCDNSKS